MALALHLRRRVHSRPVGDARLSTERPFLQEYLGLSADQARAVYDQSYARAMGEPAAYRPTAC